VEEAKQGQDIIRAFQKLGISPEQHLTLVEICKKIEDPGFVAASLEFCQIEAQTGVQYHTVISNFKKAQEQFPPLEKKVNEIKAELKSINNAVIMKKQELADQNEYLEKRKNEVKAKEVQMDNKLLVRMKQLNIEKKDVEEAATLKVDLIKKGLNLSTLVKLAKEFGHGNK
jgi:predicted patatin/cPLA2 family phospholipase